MSVWFGVQHNCEDGRPRIHPVFHWKQDEQGNDLSPRVWLVCDDCKWEVKLVTKSRTGVLMGDETPKSPNDTVSCFICGQKFSRRGLKIHQGMKRHRL